MDLQKLKKSKLFLGGLIILVVGMSPLVITMLAASLGITEDPKPNPVFLGILASFSFYGGLILMAIGYFKSKKTTK